MVAAIENLVTSARPSDMPDRVPRGQCAKYVGLESKDDADDLVKLRSGDRFDAEDMRILALRVSQ